MNIFYRDFDNTSPVSSGSKWLAALAARVAIALVDALPYGRLTSGQVWVLALLLAGWLGTSLFPVTAGLAAIVNAVLIGFGALKLLGRVKEIGTNLASGLKAAYEANTEKDLEAAGQLIGKALDEYALNAISVMVNESTFQSIQNAALRMFPIPDWFSNFYDKGIFFREFDSKEPITTGGRWFAALAARFGLTLVDAFAYTEIKKELLLSVHQLWMLGILLGGWFAVSIIPATAGVVNVVNAILLAIGLVALLDRAAAVATALSAGLRGAYEARNQAELDAAGKALAPALTGTVVTAIELLVAHQAFRAAESATLRRFPVPEWFRRRFEKAQARRAERSAERTPENAEPNQSHPPEEIEQSLPPEEPIESRPSQEPRKSRPTEASRKSRGEPTKKLSRAEELARTARAAAELEAARRAGQAAGDLDTSTLELLLGAGVLVFGLGITASLLMRRRS